MEHDDSWQQNTSTEEHSAQDASSRTPISSTPAVLKTAPTSARACDDNVSALRKAAVNGNAHVASRTLEERYSQVAEAVRLLFMASAGLLIALVVVAVGFPIAWAYRKGCIAWQKVLDLRHRLHVLPIVPSLIALIVNLVSAAYSWLAQRVQQVLQRPGIISRTIQAVQQLLQQVVQRRHKYEQMYSQKRDALFATFARSRQALQEQLAHRRSDAFAATNQAYRMVEEKRTEAYRIIDEKRNEARKVIDEKTREAYQILQNGQTQLAQHKAELHRQVSVRGFCTEIVQLVRIVLVSLLEIALVMFGTPLHWARSKVVNVKRHHAHHETVAAPTTVDKKTE